MRTRTKMSIEEFLATDWYDITAVVVCRVTGATYKQVDHWARTGLLVPSVEEGHGSGYVRRYSKEDVVTGWLIMQARKLGIDWAIIREHGPLDAIHQMHHDVARAVAEIRTVFEKQQAY